MNPTPGFRRWQNRRIRQVLYLLTLYARHIWYDKKTWDMAKLLRFEWLIPTGGQAIDGNSDKKSEGGE